jgi:acetyl-CoA C-acetyltransferase
MESMSNIPYYLPGARTGYRLGNNAVVDGLIHDGLWDVYNNQHMGMCGEACSDTYKISREEQDSYAIRSYERASKAWEAVRSTTCHKLLILNITLHCMWCGDIGFV